MNLSGLVFLLAAALVIAAIGFGLGFLGGWYSSKERRHKVDKWNIKVDRTRIEKNLKWFSSEPSLAGTNYSYFKAKKIEELMLNQRMEGVRDHIYDVLMSYSPKPPKESKLVVLNDDGKPLSEFAPRLPADFENYTESYLWTPYHAFSPKAEVTGELVFLDYDDLHKYASTAARNGSQDIYPVDGKIVLIRRSYFTSAISILQQAGAAGIIFARTQGDERVNSKEDVAMAAVLGQFGDPLTPWYPAVDYIGRITNLSEISLPTMPVMSLGHSDGEELMKFARTNLADKESMDFMGATVTLIVNNVLERREIHNICGYFKGQTYPDEVIMMGSHRDAWYKGAVDPGGATAILMEVITSLGEKRRSGWQPNRTLMFCSWDGEEQGLIGSNEFVEQHRSFLSNRLVAYLNIDSPILGNQTVDISASNLLLDVINEALKQTENPVDGGTLYSTDDNLKSKIEYSERPFFPNSDHAAFQFSLGIPSAFMVLKNPKQSPTYPTYHMPGDTFEFVKQFIDPDFGYHESWAQLYLTIMETLSSSYVLPYNVTRLAEIVKVDGIQFAQTFLSWQNPKNWTDAFFEIGLDMAEEFLTEAVKLHQTIDSVDPTDALQVQMINNRLRSIEKAFIDPNMKDFRFQNMLYHNKECGLPSLPGSTGLVTLPGLDHDACKAVLLKPVHDNESVKLKLHAAFGRFLAGIERATHTIKDL